MGGVSCKQDLPVETYTVTFDSDGGSEIKPVTVEDGGKVTKPEDPTKTGYAFKGWFNGETVYDFETPVTSNITLKAKWEAATYTVTFESDGGSEIKPVTVKDGEKVTKPAADPTKAGYTFKGWFNGETVYDFETAVTANITLKANWEVVTYNITYELNGGTGDEGNPKTYTIETADFTIKNLVSGPAATPNFVGWFSDKDLTKPAVTTITKGSTGNLSFYAKWSAKSTFTVTFNFVGVEESESASATVEDGEALTSEQLELVKSKISSDYVFEAFYTNQECTTNFDVETKFTADTTLYVKVNEIKKFTVTFDRDGGSVVESVTVKDGAKVPKPADPTKPGYTFKGWLNGADVYNFETAVTANITLKAKWEVVTYTVTFNSDGGSAVESAKVNHGEKVPKPADPTKPGYTFKGWFNDDKEYDFEAAVTANITLKAKWEVEAKEELSADGNVLTITNPKIENEWGTTVEKNCVITFSGNSAVKFVHKDLLSFDKIEFQYTVEKADANDAKISVKAADSKLENKYVDYAYPTLKKEGGSLVCSMSELKSKQAGMEYIILANNSNDNDWTNGPAWDADWKLTITKIILSKTVAGAELVLFDPANYSGEVIEKDGEKYAKITVDGYNTTISITPVDCSEVTNFKVKMYAEEENANFNLTLGIKDSGYADISSPALYGVGNIPKEVTAAFAEKTDWNTVSETKIAAVIQPMVQDNKSYAAQSGVVVYIGKIVAE